ncbi:hypothetical protein GCM10012275_28270 [Longimycelium tulufanense]|uniref:Uncharacterized protein n=1 Tax=Longimycelium tulufanense TaxID=907463 RepID=A0A8J3CE68_9PSEU|nr:hypothetical protein GCM10012275_28270 [Longimycelium tulufanense]
MAALTLNTLDYATGAVPTFEAASTSDTVNDAGNGHSHFLWYKNTNAAARTVTITAPGNTPYEQANPDPSFTLAATSGELMIPLHPAYQDASGLVTITLDAIAGVTVAYVRTP